MNSIRKTVFLTLTVFMISLKATGFSANIDLTPEEQAWLEQHPVITVGTMNNWPPLDFIDSNGTPSGIGADFIGLINRKIGNRLKIIPGEWEDLYKRCKEKKIDMLMDISAHEDRKDFFNFTNYYIFIPHIIVARKKGPYYTSISKLKNRVIAAEKNFYIVKYIRNNYPSIIIKEFNSTSDALDAVAKNMADAYIGNRAVANYIIERELISNLQFQGKVTATSSKNCIGVRKDWPILASILNKILASISEEDKISIFKKWGGTYSENKTSFSLTYEEKAWLEKHDKIVIAFDEDYAPYSFRSSNGEIQGIAVDFINEISARTGVKFTIHKDGNWEKIFRAARQKEVDIIATMVDRAERRKWFLFSEPYLSLPHFILTRDNTGITSEKDLNNKIIALVKSYSTTSDILKKFPGIVPYYTKNLTTAIEEVSTGKADAVIAPMGPSQYIIAQKGIQNLIFSSAVEGISTDESISIRNDWPVLQSIISKGLTSIDENERIQIFQRWSTAEIAHAEIRMSHSWGIGLTRKEKNWLSEHPVIRVSSLASWPPIEYMDSNGIFNGISKDLLERLGERLGIKFEMSPSFSRDEIIEKLNGMETDMVSSTVPGQKISKYLTLTSPFLNLKSVIFTRSDTLYISNMNELNWKKTAVIQGSGVDELLKRDFPEIDIVKVRDVNEGLSLLSNGRVNAYIGTILVTTYTIREKGYANIYVSGDTPYSWGLRMGVRKDLPELHSSLEKALKSIDTDERNSIYNRWWSVGIQKVFDYQLLFRILLPVTAFIFILYLWTVKLRNEIKKRKETETDLAAAKKSAEDANHAKSVFLANMSHEIRTPMNAILGHSQILQRDKSLSPDQKKSIQSINKSGEHLLNLINDILDMSKIEAGKIKIIPVTFRLHHMISNLHEMFSLKVSQKKLHFTISISPDLPDLIHADENRICQILINLIGNAIHFTEHGGITVKADIVKGEDLICITISDTGCGIPEDKTDSIFEAFEQVETGTRVSNGTGLGLSISRNLARLMGGDIKVTSNRDIGSSFDFTFSYSESGKQWMENHQVKAVPTKITTKQKRNKMLIVDDREENRDVARLLLEPLGFIIEEAENGLQAIEMTRSWKPDIVLLDIIMPVLNGTEATREIKESEETKDTVIIAISASAIDEEKENVLRNGADAFIKKPFRINELTETISRLTGIEFEYEYRTEENESLIGDSETISRETIEQIPEDIKKALRHAAEIGDIGYISELISEISLINSDAAEYFSRLAETIDLEKILSTLDQDMSKDKQVKRDIQNYDNR